MLALIIAMLMILFSIPFSLAETPDNIFSIGSIIAGTEKDKDGNHIIIVTDPIRLLDRGLAKSTDSSDLSSFLDRIEITGAEQDAHGN